MHKLVGGRADKKELCNNEKEYISVEEMSGESGGDRWSRQRKSEHPASWSMKRLEKKKYEYYDKGESSTTSASEGRDRCLRKEVKA